MGLVNGRLRGVIPVRGRRRLRRLDDVLRDGGLRAGLRPARQTLRDDKAVSPAAPAARGSQAKSRAENRGSATTEPATCHSFLLILEVADHTDRFSS